LFEGLVAFAFLARVADRCLVAVGSAWRATRSGLAGFRDTGEAGQVGVEVRESPADAGGGEPPRLGRGFPGEAQVGGEGSGGGQLGESGDHQPGPSVGGLRIADLGNGPAQGLLQEPEGVLDVEAA
jgi:hypothetical protein